MSKIKMICAYCGSEDVTRDALAEWNVDVQLWELIDVLDTADCGNCGGETSLNEVEIEEN